MSKPVVVGSEVKIKRGAMHLQTAKQPRWHSTFEVTEVTERDGVAWVRLHGAGIWPASMVEVQ